MNDQEPRDEALEIALRDAFGDAGDNTPAGDGASILQLIRRRVGDTSRGHLAGSVSGETTITRPGSRELDRGAEGGRRYEVLEEVARGGIGAVYRGRDVDLGRDVAIKVLLDRYRDSQEMTARFLEEAQIEGQLQHPGIVPVHEAGRLGDRRPFFTMKLVEGVTLGRLLKQRSDPATDRHRFLAIFEKILETMAYVHARGVIHRDLKPSNVMVGAFGEVQVMDWGLAKVLARGEPPAEGTGASGSPASIETVRSGTPGSQSLSGSVMGTPSYMSPEQARGEIETLDPRSDVFSLGAILFEILTGDPPYAGASTSEVRALAAKGDAERLGRALAAAAVDDEVRKIVEAMMATDAAARPRDAGDALAAFSGYLAALEERTRAAELRAAEERARSEENRRRVAEERKARRLTVALAVSVVAALVLGGGGFLWLKSHAAARLEKTRGAVERALEDAIRFRGQARAAEPIDVVVLSKAVAAARRARDLAVTGEADAATRERVAGLLAELVTVERAARTADAARRTREAAAARLARLRVWGGDPDYAAKVRVVLGDLDIDLNARDPSEIARRIQATGLAAEIAVVLDLLAEETRRLRDEAWRRYAGIAHDCDDDPFRREVRGAIHRRDRERLRALAGEAGVAALSPANLALLGNALAWSGDIPAAADLLWSARGAHPDDFWVQRAAGEWLYELGPERQEHALRCLEAALALNPGSTGVRRWIALVLRKRGRVDEAAAILEEAMRVNPDDVDAKISYSALLVDEKGDSGAAIRVLRDAIARGGKFPDAWYNLGNAYLAASRVREAIDAFAKAIAIDPENPYYVNNAGMAHLTHAQRARRSGESADAALGEAVRHFRRALELRPNFAMYHNNLGAALLERGDWKGAARSLERGIEIDATDHLSYCNLGWAYQELGRRADAIKVLEKAVALKPGFAPAWSRLGRLQFREKRYDEAARAFNKAVALDPKDTGALFWLGDALHRLKRREEAVAIYKQALARQPDNAKAWANLGQALGNLGRQAEAAVAYRKCLAAKPGFPWAHYHLALCLVALGDWPGAVEAYEGAIRANPRDTWAMGNLANLLRQIGAPERSRSLLERVVEQEPRSGMAWSNLGLTYYALGRLDDARRALERALELSPKDAFAPRFLQKIVRARELAPRLDAIVEGGPLPTKPDELLELAGFLGLRQRFAARLRLFEAAFQAEPKLLDDMQHHHRYDAACCAARVANGEGVDAGDLPDDARTALRARALAWLKTDLETYRHKVEEADRKARKEIRSTLSHWTLDRELSSVRGDALAKLSAEERASWAGFWDDVHDLLRAVRWEAELPDTTSPAGSNTKH